MIFKILNDFIAQSVQSKRQTTCECDVWKIIKRHAEMKKPPSGGTSNSIYTSLLPRYYV